MGGNEPSPATLSRPWLTVARIGNDKRARVRRSTLTPRTTAASAPAGFPAGTAHPSSDPGPSRDTPFTSPKSLERRALPASSLVPVATVARSPPRPSVPGWPVSPILRFLFLFIFNRFTPRRIGILRAPMLPSNRRYACTTKIPWPLRPPRLPAPRPPGVPLTTVGAQTFGCHTSGGLRTIDPIASQKFPSSPQPKAENGLTYAH